MQATGKTGTKKWVGKKIRGMIFVWFHFSVLTFFCPRECKQQGKQGQKMGGQKDRRNEFCMVSFFCPHIFLPARMQAAEETGTKKWVGKKIRGMIFVWFHFSALIFFCPTECKQQGKQGQKNGRAKR
jgi:hypothetical protein